jgi:hypothetical protein
MQTTIPNRCHASIGAIHAGHGESWVALANQMDGLADGDPVNAAHLALAR